jgi:hypothetical protein
MNYSVSLVNVIYGHLLLISSDRREKVKKRRLPQNK